MKAFAERARRELAATGDTARRRPAQAAAASQELTAQEAQVARASPGRPVQPPRSAPGGSSTPHRPVPPEQGHHQARHHLPRPTPHRAPLLTPLPDSILAHGVVRRQTDDLAFAGLPRWACLSTTSSKARRPGCRGRSTRPAAARWRHPRDMFAATRPHRAQSCPYGAAGNRSVTPGKARPGRCRGGRPGAPAGDGPVCSPGFSRARRRPPGVTIVLGAGMRWSSSGLTARPDDQITPSGRPSRGSLRSRR
jgi:hypothetical protein